MLFNDFIHPYVPLQWQRIHPLVLKEAKKASKRFAVELQKDKQGYWCWRRLIDKAEFELGL